MLKKSNSGVCCDVSECVHNMNGCDCNAKKIKVTKGQTTDAHFCRTYKCEK